MKIIIRRAKLSDAEQVAKLYLQFWEAHKGTNPLYHPYWPINYKNCLKDAKDIVKHKEYELYLAVGGDQVIGFVLITIKKLGKFFKVKKYGHIEEAAVDKNHRRMGVATKMIEFAFKHFKKKGLKYAHIGVEVDLPVALKAWESMGFKQETVDLVKRLK